MSQPLPLDIIRVVLRTDVLIESVSRTFATPGCCIAVDLEWATGYSRSTPAKTFLADYPRLYVAGR